MQQLFLKDYKLEKTLFEDIEKNMQGYITNENINVAFGITRANPQYGGGGLPQIYVPDVENLINKGILSKVDNIPLIR